jgi:hypothetical protein
MPSVFIILTWRVYLFLLFRTLFLFYGSTAQFWALAASMKLSVSFQLVDLGQSAGLLGRVICSSQGLCMFALVIGMMMEKLVE